MKQRNPVLRVLLSLLITAVLGALYFYITIPAINGHSESFYIFIIVLCVIYLVVSRLLGGGARHRAALDAALLRVAEPLPQRRKASLLFLKAVAAHGALLC